MQLSLFDYVVPPAPPVVVCNATAVQWTDDERTRLYRMWRAGWPSSTIVKHMPNRNAKAIESEASRMGLQRAWECATGNLRRCNYGCNRLFFSLSIGNRRCLRCDEEVSQMAA